MCSVECLKDVYCVGYNGIVGPSTSLITCEIIDDVITTKADFNSTFTIFQAGRLL